MPTNLINFCAETHQQSQQCPSSIHAATCHVCSESRDNASQWILTASQIPAENTTQTVTTHRSFMDNHNRSTGGKCDFRSLNVGCTDCLTKMLWQQWSGWCVLAAQPLKSFRSHCVENNIMPSDHKLKLLKTDCKSSLWANTLGFQFVNLWNSLPEDAISALTVHSLKNQLDWPFDKDQSINTFTKCPLNKIIWCSYNRKDFKF